MKLQFANSATVRAPERLMLRGGRWQSLSLKVRYGFFVHPTAGPVLIDTGYGPEVTEGTERSAALKLYARMLGPHLHDSQLPDALLTRHGLKAADVSAVIVTHFHADHVSALKQFPSARLILDLAALRNVRELSSPVRLHHGIFLELLPDDLDVRARDISASSEVAAPLELPDGYDLFGDGSVLAIPLPGHGHGHFGLCFPNESPPLLYGVDTQWLNRAIVEDRAPGYPAQLIFADKAAAVTSTAIARRFAANGGRLILCHDPEDTLYDVPEVSG